MKTKNLFLLIIFFAFTINVFASEMPKMNVIIIDNSKALIAVAEANPEKTVISFESEDGNIVYYKETYSQPEFKVILDLRQVKNGTYKVTAKSGNRLLERNIVLNDDKISVAELDTEYDPVFVYDEKKLRISFLNLDQNDFRLLIYNNGDLVYNYDMGNEIVMQKRFDFSRLNRGHYEVALASKSRQYTYPLRIFN